jgi:hypothetical protein
MTAYLHDNNVHDNIYLHANNVHDNNVHDNNVHDNNVHDNMHTYMTTTCMTAHLHDDNVHDNSLTTYTYVTTPLSIRPFCQDPDPESSVII